MMSLQRKRLEQAQVEHVAALQRNNATKAALADHWQTFLSKPLNVLYPFSAGVLVCAGQLKSKTDGVHRIPFFGIINSGIGLWVTARKLQGVRSEITETRQPDNT